MREILPGPAVKTPPFRLPKALEPRHYDIEIEPDLAHNTFKGRAAMHLDVVESTSYIVFHVLSLKVIRAAVVVDAGDAIYPEVQYTPEHECAYICLEEKLAVGSTIILKIEYIGEMTQPGSMGGLYPSPYQAPDGKSKMGFETMMEPTMARSVFPCLDEPAFKARFTVSMIVDSGLTCLSNMTITSEELVVSQSGELKKRVVFGVSPKMSTYLIVMVAGYFNCLETNEFRVPIRVWAPLDRDINNAGYALEIAVRAMKAHEENFGLEYPLPKLDMVAVPGHQGGMEHWGCVTYDERAIILNENPAESDKMQLARIVTHELGHQWFGNIVTMKWWDSVWLNESFSDWATYHALSQIFPQWDSWASFLASDPSSESSDNYQDALELDANRGSHAIQDPNVPPAAAFDSIAYVKGCGVIRMMAEDLGVDVFLRGINHYLKQHLYGNAATEDLWDALSEVSGQDVAGIMAAWTQTVGYPLLTVNELRPNHQIVVTQSRFLQNGDEDTETKTYPVIIHLRGFGGIKTYRMSGSKVTIAVDLLDYKLNADQVGFYRVSYPLSRIHKLGLEFAGEFLSVEDKIGIISDLGAVVATGAPGRRARLSDFLGFLLLIKDFTTNLFVWREILGQLQKIRAAFIFQGEEVLGILKAVKFQLLDRFINHDDIEFNPEDTLELIFLKKLIFSQLKDHPLAQKKAKKSWKKLLDGDKNALNPNIRKIIFDTVLLLDDTDETWNKLKSIAFEKAYISPTDPVTPIEALYALGSSPNPELIARTLKIITPASPTLFSTSSSRVAPLVINWNARQGVLRSLCQHAGGAEASWGWVRENWDVLRQNRRKNSINSYGFIRVALGGLATWEHLTQVEQFFADKRDESFELLLTQAVDVIRARARFAEADREDLLKWARGRDLHYGSE
ncbi:peptidase family M1-domain-containing protein [Xylariaceae sp. FL0662B]|nr:peptidase family M1-domain-containing protein [Xylariaceae sp. FL0662B]